MVATVLFFFLLAFSKSQILFEILYSSQTDQEFIDHLIQDLALDFQTKVDFLHKKINSNSDILDLKENPTVLLDLTFSISLEIYLQELAKQNQFILLSIKGKENNFHDWQFFTHFSEEDDKKGLMTVISYLNWEKFILISNGNSGIISKGISQGKIVKEFNFIDSDSQDISDLLIEKQIKPTGIRNIIILNHENGAQKLLKSLKEKNILGLESGIILKGENLGNITENGIWTYIERGLENSADSYMYELLAIEKFIDFVLGYDDIYDMNNLRQALEKATVRHHPVPDYSVINIQDYQKIVIGGIFNGIMSVLNDFNIIPNSPFTNITISMADGDTNFGYPPSNYSSSAKIGAKYALFHIKSINFLDGFEILVTHVDCGAEYFTIPDSYDCLSNLTENFGVGFLTSIYTRTVISNILALRSLNISIPQISEYAPGTSLSDIEAYPEFMRVVKNRNYNVKVIVNLIIALQWKNIILLYEKMYDSLAAYQYFLSLISFSNINIVNKEEERVFSQDDNELIKNIISYKERVYVLLLRPQSELQAMTEIYGAGLRSSEAIFLMYSNIMYEISGISEKTKIPMVNSILNINQEEWVGNLGKILKQSIIKYTDSNLEFRCFSFDAAMLLFHGIKYTINHGQNFENSTILNKNLRQQKFIGCSGTVSIGSGNNDRPEAMIGIYKIKWNDTSERFYEYQIGQYNFASAKLIAFYENVPDLMQKIGDCPFDEDLVKYSYKGAGILYGVSLGLIVTTFIIGLYIWKTYGNSEVKILDEKFLMKFEDYFVVPIMIIESLQFIAMGPDRDDLDAPLRFLAYFSTVDFDESGKKGNFWIYVYSALIAVCSWVYCCFCVICKNCGKKWLFLPDSVIFELLLPIFSSICFLPIISILLSVIQCIDGIGDDLSNSFIKQDCTTFCWEKSHSAWAVLSILALFIYLPLDIFFRPYLYDLNKKELNIKTPPFHTMSKSSFQMIAIVLNKTLKPYNQPLNGFILGIALSLFILWCLKQKPYNYHRCNLWLAIFYSFASWSILLSSIYQISSHKFVIFWLIFQYIGIISLLSLGFFIQKQYYPSLLYSEKGIDLGAIFRFALGNKVAAEEINREKGGKYIIYSESSNQELLKKASFDLTTMKFDVVEKEVVSIEHYGLDIKEEEYRHTIN
ncbi:unnamed protein product [Blepharisma stoltei]|uniref:Receptor ligand binding region domain-containing protein n=1 Tax=Blepharisma stoltei TaxID=1481888 RepID=A0AAU9ICH1_9CILI|nr:unnamed protein product [Blepharisma stoltei]